MKSIDDWNSLYAQHFISNACDQSLYEKLKEYLVRTYSKEGDTVMDNCFGGGTTGVACANLGRNFIGFEKDLIQYAKGSARILEAYKNNGKIL